jgi:hypothetical protein
MVHRGMRLAVKCLLPLSVMLWSVQGATVKFSGYEWNVRTGRGGPGPNVWEEKNVWLDESGGLHLKIAQHVGKWSCAEVTMRNKLELGRYEFQIKGAIDRLDDNVVLGLFNYPTSDVGPDATHEIDIEFARWGQAGNPIGNYTVWPVEKGLKQQSKSFAFTLENDQRARTDLPGARLRFYSSRSVHSATIIVRNSAAGFSVRCTQCDVFHNSRCRCTSIYGYSRGFHQRTARRWRWLCSVSALHHGERFRLVMNCALPRCDNRNI